MAKKLRDVFKGLRLNDDLTMYFIDSIVERICINRRSKELHIYIVLEKIVYPNFIKALEQAISEYLDHDEAMIICIKERFELTSTMDIPVLYEFYIGAICNTLKEEYPLCGVKLATMQGAIEGNTIKYSIDSHNHKRFIAYGIGQYITNTFKEKFNIDLAIHFEKENGEELIEKFIQSRNLEEKQLLRKMAKEEAEAVALPQKIITKEDKREENVNENLLVGKKGIIGEVEYIDRFNEETKDVIIEIFIVTLETRELRSGKMLLIFDATDYTNSITCKCFLPPDIYEKQTKGKVKKGMFARVSGRLQYDDFQKESVIMVNALEKIDDFRRLRVDEEEEKRVELHLHTQMSDMDAVVSAKAAVNQAIAWGHKAVAITDHGVVQAFPEAFHAAHGKDIKVIYGVEGYIVDDEKPTIRNPKGQSFRSEFVVFDIETTGFFAGKDKITEIGAVKIREGKIVDRFSTFVNPERGIPLKVQELTKITPDMVAKAPVIEDILEEFLAFVDDSIVVAHNAVFDIGFIKHFAKKQGLTFNNTSLDTLELARCLFPDIKNYKLDTLAVELKVNLSGHHRAVNDAEATAEILLELINRMSTMNIHTLEQFTNYESIHAKNYKKLRPNHIILLAKNLVGLRNLYELISISHMEYFFRAPRILKSILRKYREGIIVGSACEAGELFQAILNKRDDEEINRIASFYDYYEIQPLGNNDFMIRDKKVESDKDLIEVNQQIIDLSKEHGKLTVATGDVHFLNPQDEVYRRILMTGKKFSDADFQPPLYFRTTKEMLDEFYYLSEEEAFEVVVKNPNAIADMIEHIEPVPPDKYPPVIEGAEEDLRNMCYAKARSIYGEDLPEIVESRLERELASIIGNGYAVMYIIAQKLVTKSNEDGYLVGSRGSVGSSFAATMSDITEVNPLQPHYVCPECKFSDFESKEVKAHLGNSGCDLPDKDCPKCGHPLTKEGHDIPFETFLGFKGDKEPDIDLNFSGDYQSKAHEYTEELFGEGHVFRAGTIGTLAEKTAYGFVQGYFNDKGLSITEAEKNRLIAGCVGVRRTTGQHPGGIIVVPRDQEIYKFTPVQRPANDVKSTITTTHFDYHSIDHNLLKLDILGHDDPTIIRMLEDITGVDAKTIRLDEPKVMSLFRGTEALGITPDAIDGCPLGCLGVPEFGTDFVIQMLIDTKPSSFSDLARISGLSHGTDVWLNNAQILVKEGKATISSVISTRDDIMTYLINQGMDKSLSFTIMESVRKGRGLKPEWEEAMAKNSVPDWYIWSCKQIKYMFPKAHAVAYVMMAYRIAYFKVYYPVAYYTAFYSIRASNFDYEIMCKGKEVLDEHLADYKNRAELQKSNRKENYISKKEIEMIKDMKIVQEMYARGIEFVPIDLYTVDSKKFRIIDGKIMPSLSAIQGLGEKAADNIIEARKDGGFISIEDLRQRTKVTKTVIEVMKKNGILDGMSETNQLSLF